MSNLFKDIYSESFYDGFSKILSQTLFSFDCDQFKKLIFNDEFEQYELKQRMTHTAKVLNVFMPDNFDQAAIAIKNIIENLRSANIEQESVEYMFLPEYIAMYGLDDYDSSIPAFEYITQFTSCEFAVRPFILKYEDRMLAQMLAWSNHEHNRVKRLASEGSRTRLPWAMALPMLKLDPTPLLPILNNLKQDTCKIVRRSVANNLNDISKDNPDVVIELARKWQGLSQEVDAVVKHGCRTLLKQGEPQILKLFGFDSDRIVLSDFKIITPRVKIGNHLEFSCSISNEDDKTRLLRLEYGMYYLKQNGSLSKKVFKISEREIKPHTVYKIKRRQSFKIITTRRFYTGTHRLSIIVNGQESQTKDFKLVN